MRTKILIIAGPTCIGKSSLGIEFAKMYDGEIISCDSMQIYKNLSLGTAKLTSEEMQGVSHYLIDFVDSNAQYSVSEFKDEAQRLIKLINKKNKLPILVGGTGLYIQSLLYDYDFESVSKDDVVRKKYADYLEKNGKNMLYKLLQEKDAKRASELHENDTKRIIRALEIAEKKNSNHQNIQINQDYDIFFCVLDKDRKKLYEDINNRVDQMIAKGLENEVRNLLSQGIGFDMQSMQSIGYKEWKAFFQNFCTKQEVIDAIKQNTRRYAKRQLTWFRNREFAKIYDIDTEKDKLMQDVKEWIKL